MSGLREFSWSGIWNVPPYFGQGIREQSEQCLIIKHITALKLMDPSLKNELRITFPCQKISSINFHLLEQTVINEI